MDQQEAILCFSSVDVPGINATVSSYLYQQDCDIREASFFGDDSSGEYFGRIHFAWNSDTSLTQLELGMAGIVERFGLNCQFHDLAKKHRLLIAVSKHGHCLNDLLHRWHNGMLNADIVGVVSNWDHMRSLTEWYGLPYYHLPVTFDTKQEQETQLMDIFTQQQADTLVLARYMQVLSAELCEQVSGRCINIHHSALPSFKGAKPYHRAHERGVKLIGATAHYVNSDLDEGPIIEQDMQRVNHSMSAEELVMRGKEVEARVLSQAVRWHAEYRIMLNGHKTVVFD